MRIQTKQQRLDILQSIKERKQQQGYKLETYKGLMFFTKQEGDKFYLEAYRDQSTKPILNYYYKQEAQMLARIEQTKQGYDMQNKYKQERKEAQKGRVTGAAACADAIRAELKQHFAGLKFSVKSDTYSGGDAVRISWEDGATVAEVDNITSKYSQGHFNGMEDIYEYSNRRDDLPQAKYITTSRSMSQETEEILKPIAEKLHAEHSYNCYDANNFLYRIFAQCSFLGMGKVKGIKRKDVDCGVSLPETFYTIDFEQPEQQPEVEPLQIDSNKIAVIEYGKGLAVVGNTRAIKDELKAIGGRFNFRLTCGAGWVFPTSKLEELKTILTTQRA